MSKVLILDIETAPNVAYVWRFFKENIGAKQVLENGYLLSYAAKWLGDDGIYYDAIVDSDEATVLNRLSILLDEANIVVAHYGEKFDFPYVQARMMFHNIKPPSPFKTVDTKRVASREFHFPSYSLEHLSNALKLKKRKGGHKKFPGFELWLEILRDNAEAWEELKEYNIDDVLTLEELYLRMRPFIRNHPNVGVFTDGNNTVCPKCGSDHIHYRGYAHTSVSRFRRFQCNDCGGWGRTRANDLNKDKMKNLAVNVVN